MKEFILIVSLSKEYPNLEKIYRKMLNDILDSKNLKMQEKGNKNIYQNKDWLDFRKKVLKENNNNCFCGKNENNRPFIFQDKYNPQIEKYEPEDAEICCDNCHPKMIEKDYSIVLDSLIKKVNKNDTIIVLENHCDMEFEALNDSEKRSYEKTLKNHKNKSDLVGCEMCGRNRSDGVVLQVHHKHYDDTLNIHEYKRSDLMVLCKGCHAREHGFLEPNNGWILESKIDLDDLIGECNRQKSKHQDIDDNCEQAIRYEHTLYHPKGYSRVVGSTCVKHMVLTQSSQNIFKSLSNDTPEKIIKAVLKKENYKSMNKKPFIECKTDYGNWSKKDNVINTWRYDQEIKNDNKTLEITALILEEEKNNNTICHLNVLIDGNPLLFKRKAHKEPKQEATFFKENSLVDIKRILISYSYLNKEKSNKNDHLVKLWEDYLDDLKNEIEESHGIRISNDGLNDEVKPLLMSENMMNSYTTKYYKEIIYKSNKNKKNNYRYIEGNLKIWKKKPNVMWILDVEGLNFNFLSGFKESDLFENRLYFYDEKSLDQIVFFIDVYYRALNKIPLKGCRKLISEEDKELFYNLIKTKLNSMKEEVRNLVVKSDILE